MNEVFILVILGISLVVLEYCVDQYIFGNEKYETIFKIAIFVILILIGTFAVVKDMLVVLVVMLFLMIVNKLKLIVRCVER